MLPEVSPLGLTFLCRLTAPYKFKIMFPTPNGVGEGKGSWSSRCVLLLSN